MADGKILSTMDRLPSIPDQQAVLIWDEESRLETLAIETRAFKVKHRVIIAG